MDRKNNVDPVEKPKRKTHTSTAVKRRYNNKVYSRAYADLPKDLVTAFKETVTANETTTAEVLRNVIVQYIEDTKKNASKRRYNDKAYARIYADLPKEMVTEFKEAVALNGASVAAVFRKAMEEYVEDNSEKNN